MKIDGLHIAAFGGLKNKTLFFGDGFHVLYGENENGKTTIMNFIKMMFYGSERTTSQLAKNMRKKYTPWDGSAMAGSIDFTHRGRRYRLEREFKSSNSTDKVFLCDLDLGTREAAASDIGAQFLGLSAAAFERSVFIGQPGALEADAAAESELGAKLSNMVATGDESVSFNTVYSRLEKARYTLMSKSGRTGTYDKNCRLIAEKNEELKKAETVLSNYEAHQTAAKSMTEKIEQDIQKAAELKEQIDSEQDLRNAEKLKEMLEVKEQLDRLNDGLRLADGGLMDDMYVKKLDFCLNKVETVNQKLQEKTAEAEKLRQRIETTEHPKEEISPEQAATLTAQIDSLEKQQKRCHLAVENIQKQYDACKAVTAKTYRNKAFVAFVIVSVFMASAAVTAAIFHKSLPVVICGGFAVGSALIGLLFWGYRNKKAMRLGQQLTHLKTTLTEQKSQENEILQTLSEKRVRLATVHAALTSSAAAIASQKALLADLDRAVADLQSQWKSEQNTLFSLFARYQPAQHIQEIKAALPILSEKATKQKECKQQLRYLARDLGNLSYEEARKKLASLPQKQQKQMDFEALKQEYANLLQKITESKTALSAADASAKTALLHVREPNTLRAEIAALEEKTAEQADFCKAAELAMKVLSDSFAQLRRSYGSTLERKAGQIFSDLTQNRYSGMQISKAFTICVDRSDVFGGKESAYLSSGTEDQAYLSLRLALSELIFENSESLPLFLDDVLCRYDDPRTELAIAFLKRYSEKGQMVLFTCRRAVWQTAKQFGATCTEL